MTALIDNERVNSLGSRNFAGSVGDGAHSLGFYVSWVRIGVVMLGPLK
ncbi:MAG: hypothetical protein ACKVVP_24725 [Chloroflexota bacterium]